MSIRVGFRKFKVDFYCVVIDGYRDHPALTNLLEASLEDGYTEAIELEAGTGEKFQIRSLEKVNRGPMVLYQGVFGRVQFDEKQVQGTEDGKEADLELKPGHGLMQKNYFLYYPARNLLLYQRNSTGSHYGKLQSYLGSALGVQCYAEPLLTTDSYKKLLSGGQAKWVEYSIVKPALPELYKNAEEEDAVKLMSSAGALTGKIRLGMGRDKRGLATSFVEGIVKLARYGRTKVAKVRLVDLEEPIDLIADRIIATIEVATEGGRPVGTDMYAKLIQCEYDRRADIRAFFGGD